MLCRHTDPRCLHRHNTAFRCCPRRTAGRRACELGQRSPVNFHSVIDSPERVRRVTPPMPIMTNTAAALPSSHQPTAWRACGGKDKLGACTCDPHHVLVSR